MQLAHALVALAALASSAAADASILFCNQDNCAGSCSTQTVPGDGACRELGGIESAQTQSLDPGCSVTVYTDSNCSDGATTAGQDQCIYDDAGLLSFSYDC